MAAGAIYRVFSDNIPAFAAPEPLPRLDMINVGVDWGGNGSAHAMVATGMTYNYEKLVALRSERVPATGLTPQQIYKRIYEFCEGVQRDFGRIEDIYADSAEQTLISGLREYIKPLDLTVKNSMKRPIIDRIRATTMLMGGERFLHDFRIAKRCGTRSRARCTTTRLSARISGWITAPRILIRWTRSNTVLKDTFRGL